MKAQSPCASLLCALAVVMSSSAPAAAQSYSIAGCRTETGCPLPDAAGVPGPQGAQAEDAVGLFPPNATLTVVYQGLSYFGVAFRQQVGASFATYSFSAHATDGSYIFGGARMSAGEAFLLRVTGIANISVWWVDGYSTGPG